MPRKSPTKPKPNPNPNPKPITKISEGAGMTAGLELWRYGTQFVLHDRSADNRFATDVTTWNTALSLNVSDIEYIKNATK